MKATVEASHFSAGFSKISYSKHLGSKGIDYPQDNGTRGISSYLLVLGQSIDRRIAGVFQSPLRNGRTNDTEELDMAFSRISEEVLTKSEMIHSRVIRKTCHVQYCTAKQNFVIMRCIKQVRPRQKLGTIPDVRFPEVRFLSSNCEVYRWQPPLPYPPEKGYWYLPIARALFCLTEDHFGA